MTASHSFHPNMNNLKSGVHISSGFPTSESTTVPVLLRYRSGSVPARPTVPARLNCPGAANSHALAQFLPNCPCASYSCSFPPPSQSLSLSFLLSFSTVPPLHSPCPSYSPSQLSLPSIVPVPFHRPSQLSLSLLLSGILPPSLVRIGLSLKRTSVPISPWPQGWF